MLRETLIKLTEPTIHGIVQIVDALVKVLDFRGDHVFGSMVTIELTTAPYMLIKSITTALN